MKIATTTHDFERFCGTIAERVEHIAKAGFRYIDLNLYSEASCPEIYLADNWKDNVARLRENAESLGVTFVQCHSPGGTDFTSKEALAVTVENIKRSIEVCGMLGIKNTVVHNGYLDEPSYTRDIFTEMNIEFYSALLPTAEEYGVNILCENTTKKNMPSFYFPVSGKELLDFVKAMNHPLVHACWDTGHGNCEGLQREHIATIGKDLYALHINDNSGRGDEHIVPYFGTMNLDDVMHGLIDAGYNGYFTFESGSALRPAKYWQGNRQEFSEDTRLAEPQLFMQDTLERLMYEIGEYALKQYGCFEE